MDMTWKNIINKKKQTFIWSNKIPAIDLIEEMIDEFHNRCPSKQNVCRYDITIVKNFENEERKLGIYKNTDRGMNNNKRKYNSQVLAPYLIVFFHNWFRQNKFDEKENNEKSSQLDIGIASCFLAYSAVSKGLDIGYCGCLNKGISDYFDGRNPVLIIGVGYASDKSEYVCPIRNLIIDERILLNSETEIKPTKEEYIKYI